jgi:DNA polymerase
MNKQEKKNGLEQLRQKSNRCIKCQLHESRNNIVFGEGAPDAKLMFIGEAPGANEDKQGKPFVGRAGEVLNELLMSVGLDRKDIYIANVLKCRPPKNRRPLPDEVNECADMLDEQIIIIDPRIIVPMGNSAMNFIFKKFGLPPSKISEVAGKIFCIKVGRKEKVIIPVYHPAVAIYNVHKKPEMKEHFSVFKQFIP